MTTDSMKATPEDLLAHADWMRRLARALVRDADGAEDVLQEAWAASLRRPPAGDRPLRPWLAEVLRNLTRTRHRSRRNAAAREEAAAALAPTAAPSPEELLERHETLRQLWELVGTLDEPYRGTLLLCYVEGLAPAEIAARTGTPPGTVRWRLKRALDDLRAALDRRHGDRRAWRALLAPLAAGARRPPPPPPRGSPLVPIAAAGALLGALALLVAIGSGGREAARARGPEAAEAPRRARTGAPPSAAGALGPAVAGPASADAELAGVVRGADGRPLAGAIVTLARERDHGDESSPAETRRATSDEAGGYRFVGLAAGRYGVSARAAGHAPAARAPLGVRPREALRADLDLPRGGATLRGRVLDVGGGPIPGAILVAREHDGAFAHLRNHEAHADAEGRYELALAAGRYELKAIARGYVRTSEDVPLRGDDRRDVQLYPESRIEGRVLAGGRPAGGAEVWIGWRAGRADEEGRFSFGELPPGVHLVEARAAGLGGARSVSVGVADRAREVDVPLGPARVVSGRVRGRDGAPLAQASVDHVGPPPSPLSRARTDDEGRFRLEVAGADEVHLRVRADGHAPEEVRLPVGAEGRRDVEVALVRAGRLVGVVEDDQGAPVEGADLRASTEAGAAAGRVFHDAAISGADGRFALAGSPPGRLTLVARHPRLGVAVWGPAPPPGGAEPLVVRFAPPALVAGEVRDERGAPVNGAVVTARAGGGAHEVQATSGPDGRFEIVGLPPGAAVVSAGRTAADAAGTRREGAALTLAAGEVNRGLLLRLPAPGGRIEGVVTGPDGRPLERAVVRVARERAGFALKLDAAGAPVHSGADGRFATPDLPPGRYTLWVEAPELAEARRGGVAPGEGPVRISLAATGQAAGVVVDGAGAPVREFSVRAIPTGELAGTPAALQAFVLAQLPPAQPFRDAAGRFTLGPLPPGRYEIAALAPDGRAARQGITVEPGARLDHLRLVLGRALRVVGRVVEHPGGGPLAGLQVRARLAGGQRHTTTDERGGFTIEGHLEGSVGSLSVAGVPGRTRGEEVELRAAAGADGALDVGTIRLLSVPDGEGSRDGRVGLWVRPVAGAAEVAYVRRGMAADAAGVSPGERVVSVDGREVAGLGTLAIDHLLAGPIGSHATIVLEGAEGRRRALSLERTPLQ